MRIFTAFFAFRPCADGKNARSTASILLNASVKTVSLVDGRGVSSTASDVAYTLNVSEVACF